MQNKKKIRVGLYIDGRNFQIINTYYRHVSSFQKNFDLSLLIRQFQKTIAKSLGLEIEDVHIPHRHLYIGVEDSERDYFNQTDGAEYLSAGITSHVYRSVRLEDGKRKEKGVDGALMLEAFELICQDEIDVLVLMAADGDFVPLVNMAKKYLKDVFLFYWNEDLGSDYKEGINTSRDLIKAVDLSSTTGGRRAINMGKMIKDGNLHVFKKEGVRNTAPKTPDIIERLYQGRVLRKEGLFVFINPSNGGREIRCKTAGRVDVQEFIVGEPVDYNINEKGMVVHLRRTNT